MSDAIDASQRGQSIDTSDISDMLAVIKIKNKKRLISLRNFIENENSFPQ